MCDRLSAGIHSGHSEPAKRAGELRAGTWGNKARARGKKAAHVGVGKKTDFRGGRDVWPGRKTVPLSGRTEAIFKRRSNDGMVYRPRKRVKL